MKESDEETKCEQENVETDEEVEMKEDDEKNGKILLFSLPWLNLSHF
jgi:hypothetical protein